MRDRGSFFHRARGSMVSVLEGTHRKALIYTFRYVKAIYSFKFLLLSQLSYIGREAT